MRSVVVATVAVGGHGLAMSGGECGKNGWYEDGSFTETVALLQLLGTLPDI